MTLADWEALKSSSPRAFVTVAEAAQLLRVSSSTIRRRCRRRILAAIWNGREWRVELAALRERMPEDFSD